MERGLHEEEQMNRPICESGNMVPGVTSLTFEKASATVVAEEVARKVHDVVNTESKKGIEIEVIHYAA